MRLVLVGFGVVGKSLVELLSVRGPELSSLYGIRPRLVAVVDRGGAASHPRGLNLDRILEVKREKGTVSADREFGRGGVKPVEVIEETEADVVVEATPTNIVDGEPGLTHLKAALRSKKHVITTNKGPLALALPALMELAGYNNAQLRFSGSVGGGTPILEFARRCLLGDKIVSLQGILNGTTNFILTKMMEEQTSFEEALLQAQKAGYAEADPSMDVDGFDAACKLVILANWVMNRKVTLKDVEVEGIRRVTLTNIKEASKQGCAIKLIASADGKLKVTPKLIRKTDPLCVSGVLNAVTFTSKYAGEETIIGRGAGGMETASAVLRDLIDIKHSLSRSYP